MLKNSKKTGIVILILLSFLVLLPTNAQAASECSSIYPTWCIGGAIDGGGGTGGGTGHARFMRTLLTP